MRKLICSFMLGLAVVSTAAPTPAEAWALKLHDAGDEVVAVQEQLRNLGYDLDADGQFGVATEDTIKLFQESVGLQPDGVLGESTYKALFGRDMPEVSRGHKSSYGNTIVDVANRFYGVPYVWGGSSPSGFDCSGFVQYVFSTMGVELPRTADVQFEVGTPVPADQLQAGDLVFFETYTDGISHVGIYIADGTFIHAGSAEGYICYDTLYREYRQDTYRGARRII